MDSQVAGGKIREKRKDLNLTQKELAETSGVSYSTLRKIETNIVKNPRVENLSRIADSLQLQIDTLIAPSLQMSKDYQRILEDIAKNFAISELKNIRESQIKLAEGFTRIPDYFSTIENSYEMTIKQLAEIDFDWITPIKENLDNLFGSVERWHEIFEKFKKQQERNSKLVGNSGWFFSPSLMNNSMLDINITLDKIKEGDQNAIFLLSKKYFAENNFEQLDVCVQKWKRNTYFKKREDLIKEAIYNHKNRAYASAITLLLTQLEGIAGEVCDDSPSINISKESGKSKDKILESFKNNNLKNSILYSDSVLLAIDSYIFASTKRLQMNAVFSSSFQGMLNRHGILHGNILEFGTEANSYKCILLMDILCYLTRQKNAEK